MVAKKNVWKAAVPMAVAAALVLAGVAATRHTPQQKAATHAVLPARHAAAAPVLSPGQLAALHANESGHIPILMYHAVGAPAHGGKPRYDSQGLNIAPQTSERSLL